MLESSPCFSSASRIMSHKICRAQTDSLRVELHTSAGRGCSNSSTSRPSITTRVWANQTKHRNNNTVWSLSLAQFAAYLRLICCVCVCLYTVTGSKSPRQFLQARPATRLRAHNCCVRRIRL